jgi:ribosome-binding factor A
MSQRIDQLNSLLQQELAQLIAREVECPVGLFVTISRVEVAADAESAKVWLSVLPDTRAAEALEAVNHRLPHLQQLLNKRLVMKFVPKITFFLDHTQEKVSSINAVLDALEKDPTLTPVYRRPEEDQPADQSNQTA